MTINIANVKAVVKMKDDTELSCALLCTCVLLIETKKKKAYIKNKPSIILILVFNANERKTFCICHFFDNNSDC